MSQEQSLENLKNLESKYSKKSLNEANTRFQIIDKIIKKTFFWPDSCIVLEEKTNEGYTDYQLKSDKKTYLVIEAKKEKINFNFAQYKEIKNNKIKVKLLLKDTNTKKTVIQVKNYCNDIGCNYACITNGHEWAFFRTYIEGKSWQDGDAYILSSLKDFIDNFSIINKYLTYNKIVKEYSFNSFYEGIEYSSNERYKPKEKIHGYQEQIRNNHIEKMIKGYFDKYFGEIREIDKELLDKCYVEERGYSINFDKVTCIIEDSLSPFMQEKENLTNVSLDENTNSFSDNIVKILDEEKKSKVLILFGGKGSGKSTFLVSLFNDKKNNNIKKHSVICRVNLLKTSNDKASIKNAVYTQLKEQLDTDNLLNEDIEGLIKLFQDKYKVALKQQLDGLDHKSEAFIIKRNELIEEFKNDDNYCLSRLAHYLRNKQKAIIVNIDNTDQFDQNLQDYCFSLASELSKTLYCISIISLREERYISSSIGGYLDAYEKNGFHISSPNPQQVFLKRIEFIKKKINEEKKLSDKDIEEINILFEILENNLKNNHSEFNKFMTAAVHGNIRHGLELFRDFLFSNYTNVKEMISQRKWTITLHQIIKPMMIPTYRYYNEKVSTSVPNIFRLRSDKNSSHFTAYRILSRLANNHDTYLSLFELKSFFIDTFNMKEDFLLNIDILLKRRMIESENGLDKYDDRVQKIKITSFGYYMQSIIFKDFTYLELISSDLYVLNQQISNEIIKLSNDDFKLLKQPNNDNKLRYKRVHIRMQKVEKLCQYFLEQENLEIKKYNINNRNLISQKIIDSFEQQKHKVNRSATKSLNLKPKLKHNKNGIKKLS